MLKNQKIGTSSFLYGEDYLNCVLLNNVDNTIDFDFVIKSGQGYPGGDYRIIIPNVKKF